MNHVIRAGLTAAVCVVMVSSTARAQDTIEALVATALERSPDIRAARTMVAQAGGQVTQAALRPNPTLTGTQLQMTGAQFQTAIGIEWPLDLFRRPARVAAAGQVVDVATLSVQDRERLLAAKVREQAGRLLAARRSVDVMNEALIASRRMRELLDSRVNEGDIRKLDASIASVEVGRMEADLALARADADAAAIELRALVGLPGNAPLALRDSLESLVRATPAAIAAATPAPAGTTATEALPQPPDPEAAVAMRADVREATTRLAWADARIEEARRNGSLDMSLLAAYGHQHYGFAQRGIDDTGRLAPIAGSFNSVSVGATVTLPFRNRNQGVVASAQAERSEALELLAARELSARAELDAATLRDREARRAVEMYATNVRELARQNVEVQLEAYDLGHTPLSELLTEQRRYLEVEAAYTGVLQRAYEAQVALRRARGETR